MKMKMCCTLILTLLVAVPSFATCSPSIPSTLPITSTFFSHDALNNITEIQSDGLDGGTYYDGVDAVTTFLTCNGYNRQAFGDWQFDALNSTVRKVSISFANAIQPSAGGTAVPTPPFTIENVIAHVEDKCTAIANGSGGWNNMLQMTAGQTFQCPLIVHFFDSTGAEYRIYMAPNWTQPATPETSFVQVTCNTVASDGCNDWYVDPIPGRDVNGNPIPGAAIGRLVFFGCPSCPKGHGGKVASNGNEGDYYFRFQFHLTRP